MTGEPIQGDGTLSVVRELDNGTELAELWVLNSEFWYNPENKDDGVVSLKCYVGDFEYLYGRSYMPNDDVVVKDTIAFKDAPEEVKDEFISQMKRVEELSERLD